MPDTAPATTQPDETTQPSAADTSTTVNTDAPAAVDTQSAPNTGQLQDTTPAPAPRDIQALPTEHQSFLGKVLSVMGDAMTGTHRASADDPANGIKAGDAVVRQVNPDGSIGHRKATLHDRVGGALGIAAGAAAGLGAHGPGHLGESVILGSQEQQKLNEQKNQQIELEQKGLLQKATTAKLAQDTAAQAFAMKRQQFELSQETTDAYNKAQSFIQANGGNKIADFKDYQDFLTNQGNVKVAGDSIAKMQANGQLRVYPNPDGSVSVYKVNPVAETQLSTEDTPFKVQVGIDKNGSRSTKTASSPREPRLRRFRTPLTPQPRTGWTRTTRLRPSPIRSSWLQAKRQRTGRKVLKLRLLLPRLPRKPSNSRRLTRI